MKLRQTLLPFAALTAPSLLAAQTPPPWYYPPPNAPGPRYFPPQQAYPMAPPPTVVPDYPVVPPPPVQSQPLAKAEEPARPALPPPPGLREYQEAQQAPQQQDPESLQLSGPVQTASGPASVVPHMEYPEPEPDAAQTKVEVPEIASPTEKVVAEVAQPVVELPAAQPAIAEAAPPPAVELSQPRAVEAEPSPTVKVVEQAPVFAEPAEDPALAANGEQTVEAPVIEDVAVVEAPASESPEVVAEPAVTEAIEAAPVEVQVAEAGVSTKEIASPVEPTAIEQQAVDKPVRAAAAAGAGPALVMAAEPSERESVATEAPAEAAEADTSVLTEASVAPPPDEAVAESAVAGPQAEPAIGGPSSQGVEPVQMAEADISSLAPSSPPEFGPGPVVTQSFAQPPAPGGTEMAMASEPWMATPGMGTPQGPWQSPNAETGRAPALEPIDLPPAIEQGVDMIYIDQELVPSAVQDQSMMHDMAFDAFSGAPVDLFVPVNPIYTEMRRGLVRYRQTWGNLPQVSVPSGPALKGGATGERVAALRTRLGLVGGDQYDEALTERVKAFQSVHGLKDDGIAGNGTIDALNRGPGFYEQKIIINMERAKRLPAPQEQRKYAIVDAGSARLSLWEDGRRVDDMKVVVGKAETATPMMAAYIRYASVNPYWNVPPELVQNLIGPRIVEQGISYLTEREYQVLTNYGPDAQVIDPNDVDWKAVVAGRQEVSLRRLPSPANSMGMMKFMLPNYFGIYLHDSPEKDHFTKNELWISNGCVRVEDYKRFARWLFNGKVPQGANPKVEEEVELPRPVPVYMTYLTVQPTDGGVRFLDDPYGRDAALMERYRTQLSAAVGKGN